MDNSLQMKLGGFLTKTSVSKNNPTEVKGKSGLKFVDL